MQVALNDTHYFLSLPQVTLFVYQNFVHFTICFSFCAFSLPPPTLSQGEDAVSWHWVFDIDNAKNVYIREKDDVYNEVE